MQHTIHCQHYQTSNHTCSATWAPSLNSSQLRALHIIAHVPLVTSDPGVMSPEMARVLQETHVKRNCWNNSSIQCSRCHYLKRVNTYSQIFQQVFYSKSPRHITVTTSQHLQRRVSETSITQSTGDTGKQISITASISKPPGKAEPSTRHIHPSCCSSGPGSWQGASASPDALPHDQGSWWVFAWHEALRVRWQEQHLVPHKSFGLKPVLVRNVGLATVVGWAHNAGSDRAGEGTVPHRMEIAAGHNSSITRARAGAILSWLHGDRLQDQAPDKPSFSPDSLQWALHLHQSEDIHLHHPHRILKALFSINFTSKFSANQSFFTRLSSVLFSHILHSKIPTSRHFKL